MVNSLCKNIFLIFFSKFPVFSLSGKMDFQITCFPCAVATLSSKSSVMTLSVEVSPPPANRTTTPCTFTEWQKAFIGPHHLSKILGQKPPINHSGDSNEPPKIISWLSTTKICLGCRNYPRLLYSGPRRKINNINFSSLEFILPHWVLSLHLFVK